MSGLEGGGWCSAQSPLETVYCSLSLSRSLNANLGLLGAPCSSPNPHPGAAGCSGQALPAGEWAALPPPLPHAGPGSATLLQGSAWARCSGRAVAPREQALSQLEPAAGGVQLPPAMDPEGLLSLCPIFQSATHSHSGIINLLVGYPAILPCPHPWIQRACFPSVPSSRVPSFTHTHAPLIRDSLLRRLRELHY